MAFFGSGKDKKDAANQELVLAYLEDAQRVRTSFLLTDTKRLEVSAILHSLDEEAGTATFNLLAPLAVAKGNKVDLVFVAEGTRLGGRGQVVDIRSTSLVMTLPEELELMERRKLPRARINPKEGATVTALTGLFDGIGVNGALESISEAGCRLKVEKALTLKDEKRMHLGTALLNPGQAFILIKLNKVPKCASVMELTGRLAYLIDTPGGLAMAIVFEKVRPDLASAIRSLVASRASAMPSSVPPKVRRKNLPPETSLLADPDEKSTRRRAEEEPLSHDRGVPPRPAAPEPAPAAHPAPAVIPEPLEAPVEKSADVSRNPALLRLKKRTRTILLYTPAGYGELLKGYLLEEGYGRVLVVANAQELEANLTQSGLGLVIIDNGTPILESLEMVSQLQESMSDLPPFILAAEDVSRALVLAAHRSGVSQLLVKPYPLDEAFSALLEQQMGLA